MTMVWLWLGASRVGVSGIRASSAPSRYRRSLATTIAWRYAKAGFVVTMLSLDIVALAPVTTPRRGLPEGFDSVMRHCLTVSPTLAGIDDTLACPVPTADRLSSAASIAEA